MPVSFVSNKRHSRSSSISCSSVVWPMRFTHESPQRPGNSSRQQPCPSAFPKRIHCTDNFAATAAATSANRSGNHRLAGPYSAPGTEAELHACRFAEGTVARADRNICGRDGALPLQVGVGRSRARSLRATREDNDLPDARSARGVSRSAMI